MDLNKTLKELPLVNATSTTSPNTLKLFPLGNKKTQKFLVGDDAGVLSCYQIKKGSISQKFTKKGVRGVKGVEMYKDKVFASFGHVVKGLNKKGSEFYKLESTITEEVHGISVAVPNLWLVGKYIVQQYTDSQQTGFYMSRDKINCICSQDGLIPQNYDAVIGCQDRVIRVVRGNDAILEQEVDSSVTSVSRYQPEDKSKSILFGTEIGTLGSMKFSQSEGKIDWTIQEPSFVTSIGTLDYTKDGVEDIITGRDNGLLQMYSFDISSTPTKIFERNVNKSISSIVGGHVTSSTTQDIVISTYSGDVISFCHDVDEEKSTNDRKSINIKPGFLGKNFGKKVDQVLKGKKIVGISSGEKIDQTQKEIEKLEERLMLAKTKYGKLSKHKIAVHSKYNLKSKFILDSKAASYRLILELDIPIEIVALHSDIPVDLLDCETPGVLISKHEDAKSKKSFLQCTFRTTETTNRIEILIRTVEGLFGTLEAFVIPDISPKTSQVVSFPIKPLSLHERVHSVDKPLSNFHLLSVQGSFSLEEIHGWLMLSVEGIPDRVHDEEENFVFKSTYQGSQLHISLKRGEATFRSNNISTLSTLEELFTEQATARKTQIKTHVTLEDKCFDDLFELFFPKLEYQLQLAQKVQLINCLKEIQMQENSSDFLADEYKEILQSEKSLRDQLKHKDKRLEFLREIFKNLLVDTNKYKRRNTNDVLPTLMSLLSKPTVSMDELLSLYKA